MLNLIWNTIWTNPLLALPFLICVFLLPVTLILLKSKNNSGISGFGTVVGVGASLYALHRLNKLSAEVKFLKEEKKSHKDTIIHNTPVSQMTQWEQHLEGVEILKEQNRKQQAHKFI